MKKFIITSVLAVLVAFGTTVMAQEYPDEYLGLPGDNLNLYAVMKLFQESETLEGFEKSLNDQNSKINNLDLNGDNYVDYIMVSDYVDGDVHTIVLRAALDKNEFQDVAVFTVQKFRDGSVEIQVIGDEALYGKNYIVEPYYAETPNPGYMGKSNRNVTINVVYTTPYEIAVWPLIRYIYLPNYVVWRSSWYWSYYPNYWHPWRPFYWHYYYGYHYNWYHHYYTHYRHWDHPRYPRYHEFYFAGVRSHSTNVHQKINQGSYKSTYSHPEQRRDGEALFTSTHPNQKKRTEQNTPVISQRRSSASQAKRTQTSASTISATTRRSDNATNSRSAADPSTRQSKAASRSRTVVTGSGREVSRSQSSPAASGSRRESQPAKRIEAPRASQASERKSGSKYASETKTVERKNEKSQKSGEKEKSRR